MTEAVPDRASLISTLFVCLTPSLDLQAIGFNQIQTPLSQFGFSQSSSFMAASRSYFCCFSALLRDCSIDFIKMDSSQSRAQASLAQFLIQFSVFLFFRKTSREALMISSAYNFLLNVGWLSSAVSSRKLRRSLEDFFSSVLRDLVAYYEFNLLVVVLLWSQSSPSARFFFPFLNLMTPPSSISMVLGLQEQSLQCGSIPEIPSFFAQR